jgi:hypothetical protein
MLTNVGAAGEPLGVNLMHRFAQRRSAARLATGDERAVAGGARAGGERPGLSPMLQLQHAVGNQVVLRLIEHHPGPGRFAAAKGVEGEDEPMKAEKASAGKDAMILERLVASEAGSTHILRCVAPALQRMRLQRDDGGVAIPAAGPSVPAPAGVAAINYLATLMDQTPSGWGVTTEDDVVIDVSAYTSGSDWKVKITQADQQAHQGVRLLPGVVEVTNALVASETDCTRLQTMITSLNTVADQGADSGFYMLSAVQAHENLHITQYRADLNPAFATFRTTVEGLTVPQAGSPDAPSAKAAIKALPAFTTAMATFHAADVAANNKTAAHTNMASFKAIEHTVVDPMVNTIKARRTALTCAP